MTATPWMLDAPAPAHCRPCRPSLPLPRWIPCRLYISSVVRYSRQTCQPEPMYARTAHHQNSLLQQQCNNFLPHEVYEHPSLRTVRHLGSCAEQWQEASVTGLSLLISRSINYLVSTILHTGFIPLPLGGWLASAPHTGLHLWMDG